MYNPYNLNQIEAEFREFLILEKVAPITIKNYLSDLRHFFGWTMQEFKIQNLEFRIEIIDSNNIIRYCDYLTQNQTPIKTINRRLSTLRKFFSFCISQGWMTQNPAKKVTNITNIRHPEIFSGSSQKSSKEQDNNLILATEVVKKAHFSENELLSKFSEHLKNAKRSEKEIVQINADIKEFFTIINFPQRGNQL